MSHKFAGPFEVPSGRPARGRVTAPPSKSHAIRALVCAALAEGTSTLHGLSRCDADDVQRTIAALRTLGFAIDGERVTGAGGRIPNPNVTLDLGGSGTAFRFLTAVAALGPGPTTLTGDESLRKRPMGSIIDALRDAGVRVESAEQGRAPLVVSGGPPRSGELDVDAAETSQSLSALQLIGPAVPGGLMARPRGAEVSEPYTQMTSDVLWRFVDVEALAGGRRVVYRPAKVRLEADWSGAAFALASAAVSRGEVSVDGLRWESAQADAVIVDVLRSFGAEVAPADGGVRCRHGDRRPIDVDLKNSPDLAPLVGALGCVAEGTTRVRGAAHLRIKESDRIATVVAAARALGCEASESPDGFTITGPARHGGTIETRGDHRIAMAFAVAGLAIPGVVIDDPACVSKSYPGFWDDLLRLTAG